MKKTRFRLPFEIESSFQTVCYLKRVFLPSNYDCKILVGKVIVLNIVKYYEFEPRSFHAKYLILTQHFFFFNESKYFDEIRI
jgi:hypothetical protein